MGRVDIGAALGFGWDRFKANPMFHVLATLAIAVVGSLSLGLLAGPMLVGYYRAVKKEPQGTPPELGELFASFSTFVPCLIVLVAMTIVSFVPFGSVVFAPLAFVAFVLITEGEADGVAALKKAWEISQPSFLGAIVGMFVTGLVGSLGIIGCCVGIFVTLPIAMLANLRIAQQLRG